MFKEIFDEFIDFITSLFNEQKEIITDFKDENLIRKIFETLLIVLVWIISIPILIVLLPIALLIRIKEAIQVHLPYKAPFQITYLNIKDELNNFLSSKYVIYIESDYNSIINEYITNNYEKIKDEFWLRHGLQFVYIPKIIDKLYSNYKEIVCYNCPNITDENLNLHHDISSQDIYKLIFSYCEDISSNNLNPGLIHICFPKEKAVLSYVPIPLKREKKIRKFFEVYVSSMRSGPVYHATYTKPSSEDINDFADYNFLPEAYGLIDDVRSKIERLKQLGIDELVLQKLVLPNSRPVISKLLITNDFRIILPDYSNMEITMRTLPKAVFILFLNHPEGILFKDLPNYKGELIAIYKKISKRENILKMEESIDDIVNPALNSINEKCSRIREAFISKFDESIAQNYFITGSRATPKKIALNRDLVVIE